jgi:hypothetical protein
VSQLFREGSLLLLCPCPGPSGYLVHCPLSACQPGPFTLHVFSASVVWDIALSGVQAVMVYLSIWVQGYLVLRFK